MNMSTMNEFLDSLTLDAVSFFWNNEDIGTLNNLI